MYITKIYVRFYKSFNYDYERKFSRASSPDHWELLEGKWYPYVRMDIDPSVTTIVGANESGKSHLLDSIEKVVTGKRIERSDFCRYSQFFSVETGQRRFPDFGGEFLIVSERDANLAAKFLEIDIEVGSRFNLFRSNGQSPVIYIPGKSEPFAIKDISSLASALPRVFRLDASVPLPASIPLYELAPDAKRPSGSRRSRWNVLEGILGHPWASPDEFTRAAPGLYGLLSDGANTLDNSSMVDKQYELGRDLLYSVAKIDPTTFTDLSDAISDEREGYVNGIIQKINDALSAQLNFPRWWAQDRDFRLMVSPREYDLVFTIRDRTGTDYSFSERSNGLRYFLSYYVQLLAHKPPVESQQEILLMDEPDAYLSSQGQQDLLRILEEFAIPEGSERRDQVVYVTHSPFLINRNAAQCIRVLDKGVTDEGTRVVKDVAKNHYEPLRSSLGSFVAETSFIGGSNLFVEGLADQVLLAGVSSHLRVKGVAKSDTLDLNNVTIVPSGSASSVPYLIYLARGRDVVRPPCIALLDSDDAGNNAAKEIARGGPRRKELLPAQFVIQVGKWATGEDLSIPEGVKVTELEDLISLPVAVAAARKYAINVIGIAIEDANSLKEEDISSNLTAQLGSLFDALKVAFTERLGPEMHIEKVGFAREVVAILAATHGLDTVPPGIAEVEKNLGLLIAAISRLMRRASRLEEERRLNNRLQRIIASFLADHPMPTTREQGRLLIEEVEGSIDDSEEGDRVKLLAEKLRRDFDLDLNLNDPIDNFEYFRERVAAFRYEERFMKQESTETGANNPVAAARDSAPTTEPRPPIGGQGPALALRPAGNLPAPVHGGPDSE